MKNWKEQKVGIPSGAGPGLLPSLPSSSPGDTEMTSAAAWLAVHVKDHENPTGPGRATLFLSWCSDWLWLSVGTGMWTVRLSQGTWLPLLSRGIGPSSFIPASWTSVALLCRGIPHLANTRLIFRETK